VEAVIIRNKGTMRKGLRMFALLF